MDEVILMIVFLAILFGSHLLFKRMKQPTRSYFRIAMMVGLIIMVWWSSEDWKSWDSMLLSVLAIHGIWNEIMDLKKLNSKIEH